MFLKIALPAFAAQLLTGFTSALNNRFLLVRT